MFLRTEEYLDLAPDVVGEKVRVNHASHECGGSSKSMVVERKHDGVYAKCFRCGAYGTSRERASRSMYEVPSVPKGRVLLPSDIVLDGTEWPSRARLWYLQASVTPAQVRGAGIGYSPKLRRVIIPVFRHGLVGYQARKIFDDDNGPKYYTRTSNTAEMYWTSGLLGMDEAVVCEDVLSAIRCSKWMQGYAALGTEISDKAIQHMISSKYKRVVLYLDYDNRIVIKKTHQLQRKLELLFPEVTVITLGKDPKELDDKELYNILI